ncbi:MAG: repeat-containing protein YrrB [Verrucomicrobiota bacterium]|jgi:tetratricopeptide (TPR) repeat protein
MAKSGRSKYRDGSKTGRQIQSTPATLPVWKKLLFASITVLTSLACLELGLAVLGVRTEWFTKDPYVGFAAQLPLFTEETHADGSVWMTTANNRLDYFNRQSFPKSKSPDVQRIFCLGGSTTFGRPYTDDTSFAGWTREFLNNLEPRHWEVINAGGVSYASYRVALLMEELIRYNPDIFVIYTGHNEFLEQRIYSKVESTSTTTRHLRHLAGQLRTTSLMARALEPLLSPTPDTKNQTILEAEVSTELEKTLGPTSYTRNNLHRTETHAHFRFNLHRMVDIAHSIGAKVIFVTPASNLREVSPFKSQPDESLSPESAARWQELFSLARDDAQKNNQPAQALQHLNAAALLDNHQADLHFAQARLLETLGQYDAAKAAYSQARDEDVCPLRASSDIIQIMHDVATERGVPLVDYVAILENQSPHGIPGGNVFLDHVHPTIDAHRTLALQLLQTMHESGWSSAIPNPAVVQQVTDKISHGINREDHAMALARLCKVLGWAGKREEAYRAGKQAVELNPNNATIRYEAGLAAHLSGHTTEAIAHYQKAVSLHPQHANAHCNLGNLLEAQNQLEEAVQHFEQAVEYGDPRDAKRDQENLQRATSKLNSNQS